jgi:hypothetical protein
MGTYYLKVNQIIFEGTWNKGIKLDGLEYFSETKASFKGVYQDGKR